MKNCKKLVLIIVAVVFIAGAHSNAIAESGGPVKKLGRGIANIISSPLEIGKSYSEISQERGIIAGSTWGLLKGAQNFIVRSVTGVYEVLTFPIPQPEDYEPLLTDPEFFGDRKVSNL